MKSWLARIILIKLMGWKLVGEFPSLKKIVIAVVPHSTNFDFIIGILTRSILNRQITYLGKKELFNPLTGWFFSATGGTPINRIKSENMVDSIVKLFQRNEEFRLAIAPEGTRKSVEKWRTGFYYIALNSKVPIQLVSFNYKLKKIFFIKLFYPSGDQKKDFNEMNMHFNKAIQGLS